MKEQERWTREVQAKKKIESLASKFEAQIDSWLDKNHLSPSLFKSRVTEEVINRALERNEDDVNVDNMLSEISNKKLRRDIKNYIKIISAKMFKLAIMKVVLEAKYTKSEAEDQISKFNDAFSLFDKDDNGCIATKDLGTVMRSLGQNPTKEELDRITNDGNGTVDFQEFFNLMAWKMKEIHVKEEVKKMFVNLDEDMDGYISRSELCFAMTNLGPKLTDELNEVFIDEVLRQADTTRSNVISPQEFICFASSPWQREDKVRGMPPWCYLQNCLGRKCRWI